MRTQVRVAADGERATVRGSRRAVLAPASSRMKKTTKQPAKPTTSKPKTAPRATPKAPAKATAKAKAPRRAAAAKPAKASADSPAARIDARIAELPDWRGQTLARVRSLIQRAVPGVTEEWKWRGTPVWSHHGMLCTGETYKDVVKVTFPKGASLADPARLFNASLAGNTRRAIDLREGDDVNERALQDLVRAAASLNTTKQRR
jgi:hypothetical protein